MNINYEIRPDRPGNIPELTARIKAVEEDVQRQVQRWVQESVQAGRTVAEMEAPRGPERFREGVRIGDAIRISETRYAPGGAGGGGFYEADLYADGTLAPHLEFVFQGTADEGRGLIRPARGNVLALQKEGEAVRFREWVHGQAPQTLWWEHAREETQRTLELGIRSIR